jgi:hypothetical protein
MLICIIFLSQYSLESGFLQLRYLHGMYLLLLVKFAAWKKAFSMLRGGLSCFVAGKGYIAVT